MIFHSSSSHLCVTVHISTSACRSFSVSFFFLVWFAVGSCSEMPRQPIPPEDKVSEPHLSLSPPPPRPQDPHGRSRRAEGPVSAGAELLSQAHQPLCTCHTQRTDIPTQGFRSETSGCCQGKVLVRMRLEVLLLVRQSERRAPPLPSSPTLVKASHPQLPCTVVRGGGAQSSFTQPHPLASKLN